MSKKKETKVKSISIQNAFLEFFFDALNIPLHGEQRRARSRFVEILRKRLKEMDDERKEIVGKYVKKDADGNFLVKEDGRYDIPEEDTAKVNEEYKKVLEEELVLDVLPSTIKDLQIIRDILRQSNKNYDTFEGERFDLLLDKFEQI